jgi:hemolysin activation/secretion protein
VSQILFIVLFLSITILNIFVVTAKAKSLDLELISRKNDSYENVSFESILDEIQKLSKKLKIILGEKKNKSLIPPKFINPEVPKIDEEKVIKDHITDSREVFDPGDGPSFFIKKIIIEGNTLFRDRTLEPIVDVGDGIDATLGILALYTQELTAFYSSNGYILSQAYIPKQKIDNGIVKIIIKEGVLDRVEVRAKGAIDQNYFKNRFSKIQRKKALKERDLEKILLELNAVRGIEVSSTLKPGKTSGTSDLILEIEKNRSYSLGFDSDNFGSKFTGQARFGVTGIFGNLISLADEFFFRGVKSNGEQNLISTSYKFPLDNLGRKTLNLGYTYSDQTLGENLTILNAFGRSNIFSIEFINSFIKSRDYNLILTSGLEYKTFKNFQLGTTASSDNISDIFFGFTWNFLDSLSGQNFYNFRLQQGLHGTDSDSFAPSRNNATAITTIASFNLTRTQKINFLGSYFQIKSIGQLSSDRNLAPGLFASGGFGTVRGFSLAQLSGDWGYTASFEYFIPVPVGEQITIGSLTGKKSITVNTFLEHGRVFTLNREFGERDDSITGVGLGLQLSGNFGSNFPVMNFAFNYGYPIGGPIPSDSSSGTIYLNGGVFY